MNIVWYFTPSPRALAWITKVHRGLYRGTGGIIGSTLPQWEQTGRGFRLRMLNVLLLTTTGRKTAAARTVPLPSFAYEGRSFIVGSLTGLDVHPAWYFNLTDKPDVEVQMGTRRRRCRAVTLRGAERERIWALIVSDWPRYRGYQDRTRREIPVVELIPA